MQWWKAARLKGATPDQPILAILKLIYKKLRDQSRHSAINFASHHN